MPAAVADLLSLRLIDLSRLYARSLVTSRIGREPLRVGRLMTLCRLRLRPLVPALACGGAVFPPYLVEVGVFEQNWLE